MNKELNIDLKERLPIELYKKLWRAAFIKRDNIDDNCTLQKADKYLGEDFEGKLVEIEISDILIETPKYIYCCYHDDEWRVVTYKKEN